MSNTLKVYGRFWSTMAERYGKRWVDEYGVTPTKAWTDALDRFTPQDIASALARLSVESPVHPPTLPQFEKLLGRAQRLSEGSTRDWVRGYWRSTIVDQFEREAVAVGQVDRREKAEAFIVTYRTTVGAALRQLLDHVCELEHSNGEVRTTGMESHVTATVRAIARASA